MYTTGISLLTVKDGEIDESDFFDVLVIDSEYLGLLFSREFPNWRSLGVDYTPLELINEFSTALESVYQLFKNLAPVAKPADLYKKMFEPKFIFAGKEAYRKRWGEVSVKVDKARKLTDSLGHHTPGNRAVVSLYDFLPLNGGDCDSVRNTIIHEVGHTLDYAFNQDLHEKRTVTMNELMAIHVQEKLGVKKDYQKRESAHKRAQKLLRSLDGTKFSQFSFAEQWDFLKDITDHHEAPEQFKQKLENLEKIVVPVVEKT